jgi:ADP-heptose:LPS heptosyltransferase
MQVREYESLSAAVRTFLFIVDEVGSIASKPLGLLRSAHTSDVKKILLLRCDGIGDLVFSTPAIEAVREAYPHARIDLVVGRWCKDLGEMIPGIDNLIIHAPWGYRKLRTVKENLSPWEDVSFAWSVRKEGYDLALDLRGDLLSIVPMSLWKIPRRVARATRGGGFALTDVVPPVSAGREHEVERTLDVVRPLGVVPSDRLPHLIVPADARERARQVFAELGSPLDETILILPGAQWQWRIWPLANFAALARTLLGRGKKVAVVGAGSDGPMLDEIVRLAPGTLRIAGKLDLKALAAALAGCRAFVASDSGPAAIASGVQARGVVLFGPGVPSQFGPRAPGIKLVHEPCDDGPCYQRGDCQKQERWCMARIEVPRVAAALELA